RHRADRAGEDADFEAEILGDPRRDRVIDRAGMHAAVAGEEGAETCPSFGPVHRVLRAAGAIGSAYHACKSCHCEERSDDAISVILRTRREIASLALAITGGRK